MIPDVTIRPAAPRDHQTIFEITRDAFAPMAFADGTEAGTIAEMRQCGDLTLSLVAQTDRIIGHVAFSPASIADASGVWYGLGPIAVVADHQRQGIGTALAHAGMERLRDMGAAGCVLIGNPAVYEPMGFISDTALTYSGLSPKLVMYYTIDGTVPKGEIAFADALQEDFP